MVMNMLNNVSDFKVLPKIKEAQIFAYTVANKFRIVIWSD